MKHNLYDVIMGYFICQMQRTFYSTDSVSFTLVRFYWRINIENWTPNSLLWILKQLNLEI